MPQQKLIDQVQKDVQKAIDGIPALKKCSELEYVDTVLEAIAGVTEGLEMRKQEIEEELESA